MPKEYVIANAPQTAKKTKRVVTMAKKHRGFGSELEVLSFDLKPPNQNFDNENRKIIIKIFGLAKY